MGIKALGFLTAGKQIQSLERVIQDNLPRAAEAGAGVAKARIIQRAPVGPTGDLKNSFGDRPGESNRNHAEHEVFLAQDQPDDYGFYVEWGVAGRGKGGGGQKYFRPAIDESKDAIADAMIRAIVRAAKRVV